MKIESIRLPAVCLLLLWVGSLCLAEGRASVDILTRTELARVTYATQRIQHLEGRAEVAALRIEHELSVLGKKVQYSNSQFGREGIESPPHKRLSELEKAIIYGLEVWSLSSALIEYGRKYAEELLPSKPDVVGEPEWVNIYRNIPLFDQLGNSKSELLETLSFVAFRVEQSVQVLEVLEEQLISLNHIKKQNSIDSVLSDFQSEAFQKKDTHWHPLGPFSIPEGEGYDGTRISVSGRIPTIGIDADGVLYIGGALGGVWKSDDSGDTWAPLTDDQPSLSIGALATDPVHGGMVYAGTGEMNVALRDSVVRGDRILAGKYGSGILRTSNGGESWDLVGKAVFRGAAFSELLVHPEQNNVLFSATTNGLHMSDDYGGTWQGIPLFSRSKVKKVVTSMALFADGKTMLVAVFNEGLFKIKNVLSDHRQVERVMGGFPLSNIGRVELAISGGTENIVYAMVGNADHHLKGIYLSRDNGVTWDQIPGAPDILQGQGFYNILIAVDPNDPHVIYVGGVGDRNRLKSSFYRGQDIGAERWVFTPVAQSLHVDFHDIEFDKNRQGRFYVSNDGGIWRTDDNGETWESLNKGLSITQVISIDQHPDSRDFLVAGTQDNGTLIFDGDFTWKHADDGDGGMVRIHPTDPNIVINEFSDYRIALSRERGAYGTFVPIHPVERPGKTAFLAPYDFSPSGNIIALGTDDLLITSDLGNTWISLDLKYRHEVHAPMTNVISALCALNDTGVIVATSLGEVWSFTQDHAGWKRTFIFDHKEERGGYAYASSLSCREEVGGFIYISFVGSNTPIAAFKFQPVGSSEVSWLSVSSNSMKYSDVYSIEIADIGKKVIYLGVNDGVLVSEDQGKNWRRLGQGLPRVAVFQVQNHEKFPLLRAATFGRGVWELDLNQELAN